MSRVRCSLTRPPGGGDQARRPESFSSCRNRPWSIRARRRSCMSSAKPGLFEGVEVELGPRQGDFYPVLKGLARGRPGGGRGRVPHRCRNAAQSGRGLDLLRRQRRAAVRRRVPASSRRARMPRWSAPTAKGGRELSGQKTSRTRPTPGGREQPPESRKPEPRWRASPNPLERRHAKIRTSNNCPKKTGSRPWPSGSAR